MAPQNTLPPVWLYDPAHQKNGCGHKTIVEEFRRAQIAFSLGPSPAKEETAVLILDEEASRVDIPDPLREVLSAGMRTIVIYTGEKPLPFFRACQWLGMGVEEIVCPGATPQIGDVIRARLDRWAFINRLMNSDKVKNQLIGSSPCWRRTLRQVIEIACFSSAPVLILGESGTGKELVARLVHDYDRRPDKQGLVLLDCTTIVPELSGSEFFGHEKGAFTNAIANRDGAFALADRGTLFLDEIGELPMPLQAELLRVSQDGLYKRVGSNIWKKTQFRLVCATNRNLVEEMGKGAFRQDLYYRLSTCVVHLPPLRERRPDIPELARHFLAEALQTDCPPPFDPLLLNFLMAHPYPGNVRQLKQLITRIAGRYAGKGAVTLGDLPDPDRERFEFIPQAWQENGFREAIRQALADGVGLKDIKRIAGDVAMDLAIEEAAGNLQEAARRLEVSDRLVQGYWAEKRG